MAVLFAERAVQTGLYDANGPLNYLKECYINPDVSQRALECLRRIRQVSRARRRRLRQHLWEFISFMCWSLRLKQRKRERVPFRGFNWEGIPSMSHNLHGHMTMKTSRRKDTWPKYFPKGLSPDTRGITNLSRPFSPGSSGINEKRWGGVAGLL